MIRAVPAGGLDTTVFQVFGVNLIREVLLKNNFFESVANGSQQPAVDTIPAGEAVRWTWQTAAVEHNVVAQGQAFPQSISSVSPFVYGPIRLATPGVYDYECTLHLGMIGRIVVQ
jgi:plastocyanin